MADRISSWWTATGMVQANAPEKFPLDANDDWRKALEEAGYLRRAQVGDAANYETSVEVLVWTFGWIRDEDFHMFVEISDDDYTWTEFFVDRANSAAFFLDKMPSLSAMIDDDTLRQEIKRIRKTLVAFVRHGSGKDAIDPEGEESLDDVIEFRRRIASRREALAAEKKATKSV